MSDSTDPNTPRVLIVGATSGIAKAVAQRFAERGTALVLAARDAEQLELDAQDLRIRHGVEVQIRPFDALNYDGHAALVEGLDLSAAVVCHGVMLSNDDAVADLDAHRRMIEVNYTSYVSVLELLASYFEANGGGVIAGLSSVAGDRGRQSNYCYGATKAALTAYLSGLRGRLRPKGVAVLTVKPGPTDTPMTQGLEVSPPTASPESVARLIVRDIERRRNVCYTPRKWWPIMSVIRAIPEWVFKRLSI